MEKPVRRFSQGSPIVSSYIRDLVSKDVRQKDDVENNLPYLETLSKFSLVVPVDSRFSFLGTIEDDPFITDKRMKTALEESKIINWCPGIKHFIPLSISNDGNSLCHSLSVALWGVHDRNLALRHLVSVAMQSEQQEEFKNRWIVETERQMPGKLKVGEGNSVLEPEWEVQVKLANEVNRSVRMNNPLYDPLEDLHIFVLANILRRPIIVLADRPITGIETASSGGFSSIYLPLLWVSSECNKTPILLGYCENYFSPLVIFGHVDGVDQCPEVIPLTHEDHTPIDIRYITIEEESYQQELLKDYLCVVEIEATKSGKFTYVISAAKLMPKALEETQKMLIEFLAIRSTNAPEHTDSHAMKSEFAPPVATAQRRTSRFRCGNKDCLSFITNDSTFPYCTNCYQNNAKQAAPARRKVNSSAGITPPASLEVECSTVSCPYFASVNSFPYCQRCHLRRTSELQRSQKTQESPGILTFRKELSLEDKWLKLAMGIIDEEVVSGVSSDKRNIEELVNTFQTSPEHDDFMFANMHRMGPLNENEEIAIGGVTSTRSLSQDEPRRRKSSVPGGRSIPIRKLSLEEQNVPCGREDWQRRVSWVNEPCQKMGCPYYASLRTFPYCNQCSSEVQVHGVPPPRRKISGTARILPAFPQEE